MSRHDYTAEAEALFTRFAERHGFSYQVVHDAPVEVLWDFPVQPGLTMPVTLGLQNLDELNFGVSDFWSYFFPFDDAAATFERMLDAWVIGETRIAITGKRGRVLQLWDRGKWRSIYRANRLVPLLGRPRQTIENKPCKSTTNTSAFG